MKPLLLAAIVAMAASGPAWAQSSTATGTGVGFARSTSGSQAISGQGGSATITSNSTVPADQTVKNVPSVFAPGLAAAGLETCLGSVSGGGAFVGTGFSFGTSIPDPGCAARLDARTLWSMGLKKAAVARLCLNGDIYRAMPDVCAIYLPRAPAGSHLRSRSGRLRIGGNDGHGGAALRGRPDLAGRGQDRQEPSLQRLRCDPAALPCLGSRRSPFDAEEAGDGEWLESRRLPCDGALHENG